MLLMLTTAQRCQSLSNNAIMMGGWNECVKERDDMTMVGQQEATKAGQQVRA